MWGVMPRVGVLADGECGSGGVGLELYSGPLHGLGVLTGECGRAGPVEEEDDMLAAARLPERYEAWNSAHGAPFGRGWWRKVLRQRGSSHLWNRRFRLPLGVMRSAGEFAFQANNTTRVFEYPWVYEAAACKPGMKVIDVGSGAAGLPFVWAKEGVEVTAVDPLPEVPGHDLWAFTQKDYARLNRAFGNRVKYISEFLEKAGLPGGAYDRVTCISVIEHCPAEVIPPLMREIRRLLKPGGKFVTTIDLFVDVTPFAAAASNKWGTNIDVKGLVEASGMTIEVGDRSQLCGYPEFDAEKIKSRLGDFLIGGPALTQCLVLRKD